MISLEQLLDWLGALAAALAAILGGWATQLKSALTKQRETLADTQTRVAVLETKMDAIPKTLGEIKDELKGLRADVKTEMGRVYDRLDQKADR